MLFGKRLKKLRSKAIEENTCMNQMIQKHYARENELLQEIIRLSQEISQKETEIARVNQKLSQMEDKIAGIENKAAQIKSENTQMKNENNMLKGKAYEVPETFDYKAVMENVANNAWSGAGKKEREFRVIGNNMSLVFCGHVYEPSYECFTAGCDVYAIENGKKQILYSIDGRNVTAYQNKTVESGSYDDIAKFIQGKCRMGFVETDCASA